VNAAGAAAVARRAAAVAATLNRDGGVDEIAAERPEARQSPILVSAGKSRKANDVGGENRGEFSVIAQWRLEPSGAYE